MSGTAVVAPPSCSKIMVDARAIPAPAFDRLYASCLPILRRLARPSEYKIRSCSETAEGSSSRSISGSPNLGLSCGNPQAVAAMQPGETLLDLGSGAGFDCFLAARKENVQLSGEDGWNGERK